jgi:predicted transcriptional regulator
MVKRARLEIIKDILEIIDKSRIGIKTTPLLRKTNISSSRFKEYFEELREKRFIVQSTINN